jgi:hypothetical protein
LTPDPASPLDLDSRIWAFEFGIKIGNGIAENNRNVGSSIAFSDKLAEMKRLKEVRKASSENT